MSLSHAIRKADSLTIAELHHWLTDLRDHSLAHFSEFQVASILKIRHEGDSYYVAGVNVENTDFGLGACAEEGAVAVAIASFGHFFTVEEVYVTGLHVSETKASHPCYPCGECRQRLAQYVAPQACVHLVVGEEVEVHSFAELLPFAFSFRHIEPSLPKLALASRRNPLPIMRRTEELSDTSRREWLNELMGDMRISGVSEAVLLELENGYTVAGTNIENPAYTSSSSGFAAAVSVAAVLFGQMEVLRAFCHWKDFRKTPKTAALHHVTGAAKDILRFYAPEDIPIIIL